MSLIQKIDHRNAALCVFEDVAKHYPGTAQPAVRGLNLSIREGEFLTLLGPSGSGKSTTLMMLAGFERPTRGRILLADQDITSLPAHRRGLGVVFQNYALFPHMTVFENVAFPLVVRGRREDLRERVGRALDLVKLGALAERRPRQLSGGQQQRVALARALVFKPSLVLMDEPLGALDRQLREHMQIELSRLHRDLGVTIVFVTHDQDEALTMSDRIAVFEAGVVRQLAAPRAIYDEPADAFVATFVGETNQIHGTVVASDASSCLVGLLDGSRVRARARQHLARDAAALVSLRPEQIRIGDPVSPSMNAVCGSIAQAVFRGDHVRLCVQTPGAGEINAKIPRHACDGTFVIGAPVTLHFSADDALALPADASAAHAFLPEP